MLNQETIDDLIKLLQPTFEAVKPAIGKSVALVVGATGDGKSTLMNYLHGCDYEKSEKNNLGMRKPQLKKGSEPEICPVGGNIGQSETRYPKIIENKDNKDWLYCDLPGFFHSVNGSEQLCASISPEILKRSAQSIKGLVWVFNMKQLNVNKAQNVKIMLRYFLDISNKNTDLILNSLCVVGTRANSDATPDGLVEAFKDIIKSLEPCEERTLLEKIYNRMTSKKVKIVMSDIFDVTGDNRKKINEMVASLKLQSTQAFNFLNYSDDLKKFNRYLLRAANLYFENNHVIAKNNDLLTNLHAEIVNHEAEIHRLDEANSTARDELVIINQQLAEHEKNLSKYSKQIGEINGKVSQKEVTFKKDAQLIPAWRQLKYPTDGSWADGRAGICCNYSADCCAEITRMGGIPDIENESGKKKHGFKVWARWPAKPVPGKALASLIFTADYPVKVNKTLSKLNKGEALKTESTDTGYQAQYEYELGKGADISIVLDIENKYTPEGKQALKEVEEKYNSLNAQVHKLRQRRNELEKEINDNKVTIAKLDSALQQLDQQKTSITENIKNAKNELAKGKELFISVANIAKLLDIKDEIMQTFIHAILTDKEPHYDNSAQKNAQYRGGGVRYGVFAHSIGNGEASNKRAGLASQGKQQANKVGPQIHGLNFERMPPDGHCFYHAVAKYLNQTVVQLRQIVANQVKANRALFEAHIERNGDQSKNKNIEWINYLNNIRNTNLWADNIQIIALMQVLNRPIVVLDDNGSILNLTDLYDHQGLPRYTGSPLFVRYDGEAHYDALVLNGTRPAQEILNDLLVVQNQAQYANHNRM